MVKFDRKLKLQKLFAPAETSDVSDELLEEKYTIQGVVHHQTTSTFNEGGHYVTYCFNEYDADWCKYDDGHVKQIGGGEQLPAAESNEVVNKDAYILVFRKRLPTEISRRASPPKSTTTGQTTKK